MEYIPLIGTVCFVLLLALIIPGPDFLITIRNSLVYSRKTGIFTAIGIGLGISFHVFYSVAGLAVIISQSILIFNILKILGAIYLIYIGIQTYLSKPSDIEIKNKNKKNDISPFQVVKIGILANVLNPKATLFFLSLFTIVIDPTTPPSILAIITICMISLSTLWFSLVAIFFTQKKVKSTFNKFQKFFNKLFGSILVIIGVKIALTDK